LIKRKTALANKTIYTLIWCAFYDLQSGNGVGPILTATQPTQGQHSQKVLFIELHFSLYYFSTFGVIKVASGDGSIVPGAG